MKPRYQICSPSSGQAVVCQGYTVDRPRLPEATPADVMLAEVLHASGLPYQLLDLILHIQLLVFLEVSASQFLFDASKDLNSTCVLYFTVLIRPLWIDDA